MNEGLEKVKEWLRPRQTAASIHEIDFRRLKARGIGALILDIDDTLIPRAVNDVYPQIFEWVVDRKEEGFRLCLTSNSRHPLRVKHFGETLGVPAMHFSFKPLPFAFWRSLDLLKAKPAETAMIGDQLFMDILGANLLGIYSIYIDHGKPETFLPRIWMRRAEKWVLKRWLGK
ncbi:MAG: YqeG family HAD IIIA-type phosphatase [Candidatus Saganbacteria bacterium]|nr:YqeG family HAD IIIA-type phosphatase [Candidatus Saganbacteria bacterium]